KHQASKQPPDCGDPMARQPRGRLVQRLLAPRRHLLPQGFFDQVHLLVRIALLGQLERHEPVHVRVGESQHEPAVLALPASLSQSRVAHQRLCQPERQSLLPDTGWALKQEGLCWSSSLSHIVLQREVSTHSRDSVQFPYIFGIYLGCADATAGDPYGVAGATWSPVTNRAAERS